MRYVEVNYCPNPEFYEDDCGFFHDTFVFDIIKLEDFATLDEYDGSSNLYSQDEAQAILSALKTPIRQVESHDKYSFYDTDWERDAVLAPADAVPDTWVTIYLHS